MTLAPSSVASLGAFGDVVCWCLRRAFAMRHAETLPPVRSAPASVITRACPRDGVHPRHRGPVHPAHWTRIFGKLGQAAPLRAMQSDDWYANLNYAHVRYTALACTMERAQLAIISFENLHVLRVRGQARAMAFDEKHSPINQTSDEDGPIQRQR